MTHLISIYSLKGGSGKTTLTYQLAHSFKRNGFNVCCLDSDQQQSLSGLLSETDIPCFAIDGELLLSDLASLKADIILLDGSPKVNKEMAMTLSLSDHILIPMKPTQLEYSSLMSEPSQALFRSLEKFKPNLKGSVVLNEVSPYNTENVKDLKDLIFSRKMPLVDTKKPILAEIGRRNAFVIDPGKSVYDSKNFKAKNEIDYLTDKVRDIIKI